MNQMNPKKNTKSKGFDEEHKEAIQVACLLHDIGYSIDKLQEENDMKNHGPVGAQFVRPFLERFGYSGKLLEDMIYGIAIHQSGKSGIYYFLGTIMFNFYGKYL